jgi:hypothetical protein
VRIVSFVLMAVGMAVIWLGLVSSSSPRGNFVQVTPSPLTLLAGAVLIVIGIAVAQLH